MLPAAGKQFPNYTQWLRFRFAAPKLVNSFRIDCKKKPGERGCTAAGLFIFRAYLSGDCGQDAVGNDFLDLIQGQIPLPAITAPLHQLIAQDHVAWAVNRR